MKYITILLLTKIKSIIKITLFIQRLAIREIKEDESGFRAWNKRLKDVEDRLTRLKEMVCILSSIPLFVKMYL
jgi:hypothetical protein